MSKIHIIRLTKIGDKRPPRGSVFTYDNPSSVHHGKIGIVGHYSNDEEYFYLICEGGRILDGLK